MNEQAVQTSVLENFLKKYGIVLATHLTIPEKIQYEGTYSYKIRIDSSTATKLNRRSRTFHYYGLKSLQSAFEKGVEKGFQIINCLVTNKTLPDRKKNR